MFISDHILQSTQMANSQLFFFILWVLEYSSWESIALREEDSDHLLNYTAISIVYCKPEIGKGSKSRSQLEYTGSVWFPL